MTSYADEIIKCGQCGAENVYRVLQSTNSFGSCDLDTRPPEMRRSTMETWVQRCPACGYCASDISHPARQVKAVMESAEYREQLNNPEFPRLANSFLCRAIIERDKKKFAAATWSQIFAAWTCDDRKAVEAASTCRRMAADMLVRAETAGQDVGQPAYAGKAILVDLLRRSGQMDRALEVIKMARPLVPDEIILGVLSYEEKLIERQDVSCHTITEAFDGELPKSQRPTEADDDIPF